MANAVAEIMELPEDERLGFALEMLRLLTCDDHVLYTHFVEELGLSPAEAKILSYIALRAPRVATKQQLMFSLYNDGGPGIDDKILDVYVSRMRKLGLPIKTVWGVGWSMAFEDAEKILPKPDRPVVNLADYRAQMTGAKAPVALRRWTVEEDAQLRRLAAESELAVDEIALKLGRSRSGIGARLHALYRTRSLVNIRSMWQRQAG